MSPAGGSLLTFKVLSALLAYPDDEIRGWLAEMEAVLDAERRLPPAARLGVQRLLAHLRDSDPMDAQATYVRLFDQSRALSLHLFEHVHGESRARGQALVDLLEHYRAHGFEIATNELPDYLPLLLEFLATRPEAEARALLGEAADVIALIGERLRRRESVYAGAFAALEALAAVTADRDAVREAVGGEAPDDTPEALDRSWEDAPVTFTDAPAPEACAANCGAAASMVARFLPESAAETRRDGDRP